MESEWNPYTIQLEYIPFQPHVKPYLTFPYAGNAAYGRQTGQAAQAAAGLPGGKAWTAGSGWIGRGSEIHQQPQAQAAGFCRMGVDVVDGWRLAGQARCVVVIDVAGAAVEQVEYLHA